MVVGGSPVDPGWGGAAVRCATILLSTGSSVPLRAWLVWRSGSEWHQGTVIADRARRVAAPVELALRPLTPVGFSDAISHSPDPCDPSPILKGTLNTLWQRICRTEYWKDIAGWLPATRHHIHVRVVSPVRSNGSGELPLPLLGVQGPTPGRERL